MRDIESRRIAREGYAFHAMLEVTMGFVIEDDRAARTIFPGDKSSELPGAPQNSSLTAYRARQRVDPSGFDQLRGAILQFGGALTELFLRLDRDIGDYRAQWISQSGYLFGTNVGLLDELNSIEQQAILLREEAAAEMKRCRDELIDPPLLPLKPDTGSSVGRGRGRWSR